MFSCSLQLHDNTNKMNSPAEVEYFEKNSPNRVNLINYSKLDIQKFPTGKSFGAAGALAFGGNKALYFAAG